MTTTSWMHRSVARPDTIYDLVDDHFLGFLMRVGYEDYARKGQLDRLRDHLRWARAHNEHLVAFFYFWFFYATIQPIMTAVDQIERRAKPWMDEQTLTRIREFAKSRMWDLRTVSFLPQNTKAVAQKLRDAMVVAVICRDGHVLDAPELSARNVIRRPLSELVEMVFAEQIEDIRQTGERAKRIRLVTRAMRAELQEAKRIGRPPEMPREALELECLGEPWLARIALIER